MIDKQTNQEVVQTLIDLKNLLDRLILRGLSSVDVESVMLLSQAQQLFSQQGAAYLASCLQELVNVIAGQSGDSNKSSGKKLLQLQTALFLFERLFTQSVCLASFEVMD